VSSGLKDEKPLALRTWSLNGGVIRIQLTRLADFADGDAIHGAIHAFTKALAGSRAPSDAALVEALEVVMMWIDNWDPNFTEDDAWPSDRDKARAALAAAKGQQP